MRHSAIVVGITLYQLAVVAFGMSPVELLIPKIRQNITLSISSRANIDDWVADNVIDGNNRTDPDKCLCCFATHGGSTAYPTAWWQMDLGSSYLINTIEVYGRTDHNPEQSRDFIIATHDSAMTAASQGEKCNSTYDEARNMYIVQFHPVRSFRFLIIGLTTTRLITICEVKLYTVNSLIPRIRSGVTVSSSTAIDGYPTAGAIDDNPSTEADTCHCCFATPGDTRGQWWHIDLGRQYSVFYIEVYGRTGNSAQFKDLKIDVSNSSLTEVNPPYRIAPNYVDETFHVEFRPSRVFQYLIIGRPTNNAAMTICELKIYNQAIDDCQRNPCVGPHVECKETYDSYVCLCLPGYYLDVSPCKECLDGRYGINCSEYCGHCRDNHVCNKTNGSCPDGCAKGYEGSTCNQSCNSTHFGHDCQHQCHCSTNSVCDKLEGTCSNGCDFGWTGDNCSIDLSITKPTLDVRQSSSHATCTANKAIDGRTQQSWKDVCDTCSATDGTGSSWWQVDLGQLYLIGYIRIHGRTDGKSAGTTNNLSLYGSNTSMHDPVQETGTLIGSVSALSNRNERLIVLQPPRVLRFMSIRNALGPLTLCEVKLYQTECNVTRQFGDACLNRCYCSDNKPCGQIKGTCQTTGCLPGWQGDSCNETCAIGFYGKECAQPCGSCTLITECNHVDGVCSGTCMPGRRGNKCNLDCAYNMYGQNCTKECLHCMQDTSCDKVNGDCQKGCLPGYYYSDLKCNTECSTGSYGDNCTRVCGHCLNISTCDHADGSCHGPCMPGYQTSKCDQECGETFYGQNCSSRCLNCRGGTCNNVNGHCPGGCEPGYNHTDILCQTECRERTFGDNCSSECHCSNSTDCPKVTGTCLAGSCEIGYIGPTCSAFSATLTKSETDTPSPGGVIGGVIAAVVAVSVVVVAIIFYRRRLARIQKGTERQPNQGTTFSNLQVSPVAHPKHVHSSSQNVSRPLTKPKPNIYETSTYENPLTDYYNMDGIVRGIKVCNLWTYVKERVKDDSDELDKEFAKLPSGLQRPCTVGEKPELKSKNRYKDMYAYDHSRVVLKCDSAVEGDYVNASYINGQSKVKKFIAAQGPTKTMINDFWRLVWQEKSNKIVMLTRLVEMATMKCLQYWPDRTGETTTYGNVNVTLVEDTMEQDYTIRTLEVTKGASKPKTIRQFHFTAWPDKDIPDTALCLVDFWRTVDTRSSAVPIVVHCSAGIGRTGTFIALDNLVDQARSEGYVRPMQIVEALRVQRVNMVQTRHQYAYLHEALAEALLTGTHYIDTKHYAKYYQFMTDKDAGKSTTRIEEQYKLIDEGMRNNTLPKPEDVEYSNMDEIVSGSDAYRPRLKKRGSDIIQNLAAYFLPSFAHNEAFLVSMSPGSDHLEEFWSLVEEQHIITVIMLTASDHHTYQASGTLGGRGGTLVGPYSVSTIQEKNTNSYTERGFSFRNVNNEDNDYLTTVKQFEYHGWREGGVIPGDTKSMLDLLDAVQRWQPHLSESKPILVHCGNGYLRSGLVAVLLNELQRIRRNDGHMNLVESVFTMKQRNHGIIASADQLRYCYDVLSSQLQSSDIYQNV